MPRRIPRRLKYETERLILRGTAWRLLVIALLLGLLSVAAGLVVLWAGVGFDAPGPAIWWAFLRLTDPGYLGDDEGAVLRVVSTALTVLGFVIFVGALIATMTQWLQATIRTLESGLTPIAANDHILILGWTSRSAVVVRELLLSEGRVRRFLRRHGARRLQIVVLAEEVTAEVVQELRDRLGRLWKERQVTFRSGTPLRLDHLRRVDFRHASALLLPGADFAAGGAAAADTRTVKALLSMSNHAAGRGDAELPLAVAEIHDARYIGIARRAYAGPIEIIAGDAVISRLIAQNVRHRGLSDVYGELLTHGRGSELYVRELPRLTGRRVQDLGAVFPRAVVCGIVRAWGRSWRPILNPPDGLELAPEDRLVLLARAYDDTEPLEPSPPAPPVERGTPSPESEAPAERRLLVLGWSHKVPALIREFGSYRAERFRLDVLSLVPAAERAARLERHGLSPDWVHQLEGDYTAAPELERVAPRSYDNVVLLGSDWLESGEESDARTLLGYLLLRELVPEAEPSPGVLIELLDPGNVALLRRRAGEVLISPLILSHMLAQVALRPELRAVFDELFGPGGAEIDFRSAASLGLAGREVDFAEVQRAAAARGETALGLRLAAAEPGARAGVQLNPPRAQRWRPHEQDAVVVLTTFA